MKLSINRTKNFFLFLFFMSAVPAHINLVAQPENQEESYWQKFKRVTKKVKDEVFQTRSLDYAYRFFLLRKLYRCCCPSNFVKIASENDALRPILDPMLAKAGLDPNNITIVEKSLSTTPVAASGNSTLIISDKSPIALKTNSKEFTSLMAHEIMHLKNKDPLKHILVALAGSFVVPYLLKQYDYISGKMLTCIKNRFAPQEESRLHQVLTWIEQKNHSIATSWFISMLIQVFICAKHMQFFEKRADIQAAQLYPEHKVAENLITTMKNVQKHELDSRDYLVRLVTESSSYSWTKKVTLWMLTFMVDKNGDNPLDFAHPSLSERIKYLGEIAQQQTQDLSSPSCNQLTQAQDNIDLYAHMTV